MSLAQQITELETAIAVITAEVSIGTYDNTEQLATLTFALEKLNKLESDTIGLPLGAIIPWDNFNETISIPDGFVVCSGQVLSDPDSPLNGTIMPNLQDDTILYGHPTLDTGPAPSTVDSSGNNAYATYRVIWLMKVK